MTAAEDLAAQIDAQGRQVREVKAAKADKAVVQAAVDALLALKAQYKALTGKDFAVAAPVAAPAAAPAVASAAAPADKAADKKAKKEEKKADPKDDGAAKKQKKDEVAKETKPAAPAVDPIGDKFVLYFGENEADNLKVALVVIKTDKKKDLIVARNQPAPVQVLSLPALHQPKTGLTIFGATAVALFLCKDAASQEVRKALQVADLVLAPAVKSGDAAAVQAATQLLAAALPVSSTLAPLLYAPLASVTSALPANLQALRDAISEEEVILAKALWTGLLPALSAPQRPVLEAINYESAGLLSTLRLIFTQALQAAFPAFIALQLEPALLQANLLRCNNPQFGDFQCNNAMALSKALKGLEGYSGPVAPKDIAERIVQAVPETPLLASVTAAPNGFVNIHVHSSTLVGAIASIANNNIQPPALPQRKVLVDFSSPNIAKEMHVGHLRSTIIGDCLCRLLEFCKYEVLRVNHVGDWGTQFGMLITYLLEAYPNILDIADRFQAGTFDPSAAGGAEGAEGMMSITDLTAIYKASKKRFDEDKENFKERSRLNVVSLQSGDAVCTKIWKLLCTISRLEFEKVYRLLGITLEETGESFYNPYIPFVIEELETRGMVFEDQGMKVIKLPHFTIPLIMRKSDGGYGYDSTDMAALKYRLFALQRDWIVIITDAGQATHFHMCYDAGQAAGWVDNDRNIINQPAAVDSAKAAAAALDPQNPHRVRGEGKKCRLDHIGFGVVCGEDGKRFKTRSSETVRLIDLLNAARDQMYTSLMERITEGKSSILIDDTSARAEDGRYVEVLKAAEMIGYGAVKYFDLKQHPSTNYIFNYDRMLDTKGDTAVYLMFAYARVVSILRKAERERGWDMRAVCAQALDVLSVEHAAERALAFELLQFGDMIKSILQDLLPNRLCDYLKEISVKFTDFVTRCHVLNAPEERLIKSRLVLCEAARRAMEKCFSLLGIQPLDKI